MHPALTPPTRIVVPHLSAKTAWRWLTAASIVGNIFLTYYSRLHPFNGQSMEAVSAKYPTLFTPAGYAFSIWGLIFLGQLLYAGWQLLPAQQHSALPDAVARPLTLANVATAAWVVLFANELILPCLGVMLLILGALIVAYGRARRRALKGEAFIWPSWTIGLYLGWISVATIINASIALLQLGWTVGQGASVVLASALVGLAVSLGLLMSWVYRECTFALVIGWALAALWVARLHELPELGWAALTGAAVVVVGGIALAWAGKRREPWEIATEAAAAVEAEIAARRLR